MTAEATIKYKSMDAAAVTKEKIDSAALMQKVIKMMVLGYNHEQIERLSRVVVTASQLAGISVLEAIDILADAISTRNPQALVSLGAVTKRQIKVVTEAINAGAETSLLFDLAMANLELAEAKRRGKLRKK